MSVHVANSREGIKDYRLSTEGNFALFMWFVSSSRIFLAKAVYMVLGSSYFLVRRRQVQLLACKVNTENVWRENVPPPRIFLVLGSFSLHVNNLYDSQVVRIRKSIKN